MPNSLKPRILPETILKENTLKAIETIQNDAPWWVPRITRDHFTWLPFESHQQVQLAKTRDEFWKLKSTHQVPVHLTF